MTSIKAIAAGAGYTIALKNDGTVWAWGDNELGQLGDGTTIDRSTPVQVPGLSDVAAISAGQMHAVVLKSDGTVWTWGGTHRLQGYKLGYATTSTCGYAPWLYPCSRTPVQVPGLDNVAAIAAGGEHTVALKTDGTVWAWGDNYYGQLGDGTTISRSTPVQVPGLGNVAHIAVAYAHTVALKADKTVWAWGWNSYGQIGDGTTTNRTLPVPVQSVSSVAAIAAGDGQTVALKTDGTIWAWGSSNALTPLQVPGPGNFVAIVAGGGHAIALKTDGTVWAWGSNYYGQLGDGTTTTRSNPVQVLGVSSVATIAAGSHHTAVLKTDGTIWTWGANDFGQLGDGMTTIRSTPVQVPGLSNVAAIAAGRDHTVALRTDGTVLEWGSNFYGQLGDGTTTNRSTPVQVLGLSNVAAITAGSHHTVALKTDRTVWAWGFNSWGELGVGTTTNRSTPVQVPGLNNVAAIATGGESTFALKTDGTVWAWGYNSNGELGDGTTTDRSTPVQVLGLSNVAAIFAGGGAFARKTDGTVWAWGWNAYGQLGDGTSTTRLTPVQVLSLSNVAAIVSGSGHTFAIKGDGTVWTWGDNALGQLGDGTTTNRLTPAQAPGLNNLFPIAAAAGGYSMLALRGDGSVMAWGGNSFGQIGDGTFVQHFSPALVVNPSVDGYLNLNSDAAIVPPQELKVPFFVSSTGGITDTSATVTTTINFNAPAFDKSGTATGASASTTKFIAADVGALGSVYVTGWVPRAALATLGIPSADGSLIVTWTRDNPNLVSASKLHIYQGTLAETDNGSFVLVQKTASGWRLVGNAPLIPYATGVLNDELATQKILDGIVTTNLKGAVFCLGYGTSAPEMTASGRMRAVATIPDPTGTVTATVSCIVQGLPVTLKNYSDSWWNANESGWGITIIDHGSNAFVQWYTYDQFGHNQKYVISNGTFSSDKCQFTGAIGHVTGPSWTLPTFDSNLVSRSTVGSGTIDFCPTGLAAGTIVFNYTADGVTGSKQLTRLAFGNDVPLLGGTANTGAADYTDLWWNSAESGWGVSLTQHGNTAFFRVFVYDTDGRPLLFVVSSAAVSNAGKTFTGPVTLTTGPWFGSNPFDPNQVTRTTAGTAALTFSDANNGSLSYTVNGVTKTKTITRMVF